MSIRCYSPAYSRNYLIIPHPPALYASSYLPNAMVGRFFDDPVWKVSPLNPSASVMRDWELTSEQGWVARNLLSVQAPLLRRFVDGEMKSALARGASVDGVAEDTFNHRGPSALWALALTYLANEQLESGTALLDFAIDHAPAEMPEAGNWSNYAALVAGLSTFPTRAPVHGIGGFIKKLVQLGMPIRRIEGFLIELQVRLDNSENAHAQIIRCGLGKYQWQWSSMAAEPVRLVFASQASAVNWLVCNYLPVGKEQATLRSKIAPIRDALRKHEIVLLTTAGKAMIEPSALIRLVDDLALKGTLADASA